MIYIAMNCILCGGGDIMENGKYTYIPVLRGDINLKEDQCKPV